MANILGFSFLSLYIQTTVITCMVHVQ